MKLVPHRNFPRLGQWIPFLQQVEETSDDIDYREIDAAEFQAFCTIIDPTEEEIKAKTDAYNALHHIHPLIPRPMPIGRGPPSKFLSADYHIKNSGLEEHITMETLQDSLNNPIITGVSFRNLKIKGDIAVVFSTLNTITFQDSKFSGRVNITTLDTIQGESGALISFAKNKFSRKFSLTVANPHIVKIEYNDISSTMDMLYNFTSLLPNDHDYSKDKKTHNEPLYNNFFINFFENKINRLNIRDISEASGGQERVHDNPLERIEFTYNNHIGMLTIDTKQTVLTTYAQLKADIYKIFFSASDKIGYSPTKLSPQPHISPDEQLTYGRFFSLLEAQASEQHDRGTEEKYKRKARYFYRKFLPHRKDRFIFGWTDWVSEDGTSWTLPLLWLMGTEALLAGIAYYFLFSWDLTYFLEGGWQILLTLFSWFMNPASLLPLPSLPLGKETIAKAWQIYPLFLFQKIFAVAFYYEAVKALRRFTR